MNRDFDEELGRSRQDGRRRESGTPDDRAEYSGGRRGEAGNGEYSRRHSSHRAGYGTAGADYRSEQELWEERKRRQLHQEEAVSLKPFLEERNAASEARSARDGAEAGQQPPEAEAHVRRREGNSPLRPDKAPVRLRQAQMVCLPEFRLRFRKKRDAAVC